MSVHKTLPELMQAESANEAENVRPYKVTPEGGKPVYVMSNSPGQAAQQVCVVEVVSVKEQNAALRELVAKKG